MAGAFLKQCCRRHVSNRLDHVALSYLSHISERNENEEKNEKRDITQVKSSAEVIVKRLMSLATSRLLSP